MFSRTFHPDEANQAFTVGRLLETGHYTYRPTDHHGPTLYYAAAPLQRAFGHTTTADLDGTLLRCTPLLFAVLGLALLAHAVFRLSRSWLGALMTVLLVGTAPLFAFFATDFIQEMLLVCFTLTMLWAGVGYERALHPDAAAPRRLKPGSWALLLGIGAGLAFATKETSLLTFAAAGLTLCGLWAFRAFGLRAAPAARPTCQHVVLAALGFLLTAVLFFSSFCQDWHGVYNAFVAAPLHYLGRAVGNAAASEGANWHIHPWWQHLQWLFCGNAPLPRSSSGFTVDLAFANILPLTQFVFTVLPLAVFAVCRRNLREHLNRPLLWAFFGTSLYTALLLSFYSILPYKTPWCTLQLLVPFLVSVSLGLILGRDIVRAVAVARGASPRTAQVVASLFFLVALPLASLLAEHVPGLVRMARDPDSPAIPYNYAHASPEARQLAACVAEAVAASPSKSPFVAVALPPADTWPFPWYNRTREHLTGYWTKFDDLVALAKTGAKPTVVVVPMTEGHLVQPLFPHLTHTKRFYMRPRVRVRVFW